MRIKDIFEDNVHYNHHKQMWQVRHDDTLAFKYQQYEVLLKDPKPHVDFDRYEDGRQVYAFLNGNVMSARGFDISKFNQRPIRFQPNNTETPFVFSDTGEPFTGADYVYFNKNKVISLFA